MRATDASFSTIAIRAGSNEDARLKLESGSQAEHCENVMR